MAGGKCDIPHIFCFSFLFFYLGVLLKRMIPGLTLVEQQMLQLLFKKMLNIVSGDVSFQLLESDQCSTFVDQQKLDDVEPRVSFASQTS